MDRPMPHFEDQWRNSCSAEKRPEIRCKIFIRTVDLSCWDWKRFEMTVWSILQNTGTNDTLLWPILCWYLIEQTVNSLKDHKCSLILQNFERVEWLAQWYTSDKVTRRVELQCWKQVLYQALKTIQWTESIIPYCKWNSRDRLEQEFVENCLCFLISMIIYLVKIRRCIKAHSC